MMWPFRNKEETQQWPIPTKEQRLACLRSYVARCEEIERNAAMLSATAYIGGNETAGMCDAMKCASAAKDRLKAKILDLIEEKETHGADNR